ncbi:MAG: glycosyltransferase, partial [Elusimicrobia bacterium]|nr:glycosyltransferase [Elusimicrobiota bacterium]
AVSRAALEGMAAGRPVVASRVGGLPDLVADGETGLLVPPGDAGALAAALGRLAGEPQFAARLGSAARRRCAERFSLERFGADTEGLYGELLGRLPR